MSKKKNFGKTYNQLKVGLWASSDIGQEKRYLTPSIVYFCLLTMNHHPIHIDKVFAEILNIKKYS